MEVQVIELVPPAQPEYLLEGGYLVHLPCHVHEKSPVWCERGVFHLHLREVEALSLFHLDCLDKRGDSLDNRIIRAVAAPNLAMQRLTTRQPDIDMLEVSIKAFKTMMAAETLPLEQLEAQSTGAAAP